MGSGTLILGGRGLVGSAIRMCEAAHGGDSLSPSSAELDLTDRNQVFAYFEKHRPDKVYLAAARVGGILENSRNPVAFINENLCIQLNVLEAAHRVAVGRLMVLGSSCIYPRECRQPMRECDLFTGPLEPTNSAYAMAKLAGLEQVLAYNRQYGYAWTYVIPPNVYGPRDHFFSDKSHVISGLMSRIEDAKRRRDEALSVWGTGAARREFIYVEDLADILRQLMNLGPIKVPLNVGVGEDVSIRELVELLVEVTGFSGAVEWDATKPDGMPRKLMDSGKMHRYGLAAPTSLRDGLTKTYGWFLENYDSLKAGV